MKRSGPIPRRTPLRYRAESRKRGAKEREAERMVRGRAKKDAYAQARIECRQKAGDRCERCGMAGGQTHHIRLRSQGGSDEASNLAFLCESCHATVHSRREDAVRDGWIITSSPKDQEA